MNPTIRVVYPGNGHSTFEAATFVMGQVTGENRLTLNGQPVAVGPNGFFSQTIRLAIGENRLALQGSTTGTTQTVLVKRNAPWSVPTTGFLKDFWPLSATVEGVAGLKVPVRCVVAPSVQAVQAQWVTVSGQVLGRQPLGRRPHPDTVFHATQQAVFAELHWQDRPIPAEAAMFEGYIPLPQALPNDGPLLRLQLVAQTSTGLLFWDTPTAGVTVWSSSRTALVTADVAVVRTAPTVGARLAPWPKGVRCTALGLLNNHVAVALEGIGPVFVAMADIRLEPAAAALLPVPLQTLSLAPAEHNDEWRLTVPLPWAVPFHYELQPDGVSLTLFDVEHRLDFLQEHQQAASRSPVTGIHLERPSAQAVRLLIDLKQPLCGIVPQVTAKGLVFRLRLLPADWRQWRIALDPGHGGSETGGVGLDGTPEKALNLAWAKQVEAAFRTVGVQQVTLLRTTDETVSLPERERRAMAANAHLCLSLHHNALPDGRDPQRYQGVSTYYYHGMAQPLARALQTALVTQGQRPDAGLLYDSLYMTRLTGCLGILVEAGFMTHPDDYAALRQPETLARLADALVAGVQTKVTPYQ